jgi:methylated-DNA-[protein]-cysteine S-methyltransferase
MTTDLIRHTVDTPLGAFGVWTAADDGAGVPALHAAGFTEANERSPLEYVPGLGSVRDAAAGTHPALDAVRAYFDGELDALGRVPLHLGPYTDFRGRARSALIAVAPSEIISYTELANRAGNPRAVRAAANVCATNPIALFVPCHRIRRTDGTLGGFLYGLDIKRALIDHELKYAAA